MYVLPGMWTTSFSLFLALGGLLAERNSISASPPSNQTGLAETTTGFTSVNGTNISTKDFITETSDRTGWNVTYGFPNISSHHTKPITDKTNATKATTEVMYLNITTESTTSYSNATTLPITLNRTVTGEYITNLNSVPKHTTKLMTPVIHKETNKVERTSQSSEFSFGSFSGGVDLGITVSVTLLLIILYFRYRKLHNDSADYINLITEEDEDTIL